MLLEPKLSKENWGEAVCTEVNLKNRWPTKSLKGIIPYESWFEETQLNMSRVFCCDAYGHISKIETSK